MKNIGFLKNEEKQAKKIEKRVILKRLYPF